MTSNKQLPSGTVENNKFKFQQAYVTFGYITVKGG